MENKRDCQYGMLIQKKNQKLGVLPFEQAFGGALKHLGDGKMDKLWETMN